ncbi:glucosaminidase domain-containing protein [Bacillus sp. AGMB 02131]|uniref:Glucosaminidase domain-containing protein n=1 Tax=Peribacillus faecalis TaxID=2772559 RepID=A0A927CYX9_9BACI|nr:glucosaminidase domain-containing protein [Peribacillus faecalis]MBD3109227.1 glucosaminidase domain-containing protein [Peribacillus faecalis]
MNWKKHLMISSALITTLAVSLPVSATSLTEQRDAVNQQADAVQEDMAAKRAEAEELAAQKQQAYEELQALSLQVANLEIQMYEQTSELIQIKERIAELEIKEQEAKEQLDKRLKIISNRLVALQEQQSDSSIFSILIESNSIADFVNRALTVSYIIDSDQSLMDTYEKEEEEYNNLKLEAKAELAEAEKVQAELDRTKAELDAQQQKKNEYMEELNSKYGWTIDNISSLQAEFAQLEQESNSLDQQIKEEEQRKLAEQRRLEEEKQAQESQNSASNGSSSNSGSSNNNSNISSNTASSGRGFDVRNMSGVTASSVENILTGKLSGYGSVFYQVGHSYGINPAFMAAIAMSETGGNSAWLNNYNNVGGFIFNGPMKFNSIEDSIKYMGSVLTRLYINDGLYTVEAIHSRYSPVGATNDPNNLNVNWVKNVYNYLGRAGAAI